MADAFQDNARRQVPIPADEGDHSIDGAFKLRDNKIVNATANASNKATNRHTSDTPYSTADLAAKAEKETRRGHGYGNGPGVTDVKDELEVMCGPLLNYKGMSNTTSARTIWNGSVLIVTKPGQRPPPALTLKCLGLQDERASNALEPPNGATNHHGPSLNGQGSKSLQDQSILGVKLYEDPLKAFWRFVLDLPLKDHEVRWEYSIANIRFLSGVSARNHASRIFAVPSMSQSMHIMFHSCNGFSVGTDEDAWSGPALWNDVLRSHEQKPFHVMIGGGDQIYNDGVRVDGPLKAWTAIGNPKKRREYHFDEELRKACDMYYFNHYVEWYTTEPFASANGQIPQVNIWDDHGTLVRFCDGAKKLAYQTGRHH